MRMTRMSLRFTKEDRLGIKIAVEDIAEDNDRITGLDEVSLF